MGYWRIRTFPLLVNFNLLTLVDDFSAIYTVWKVSKYGVFSDLYFPAFELNTERSGVSLHIQSECGKTRTRKNSVFGLFSSRDIYKNCLVMQKLAGYVIGNVFHIAKLCEPHLYSVSFKNVWLRHGISKTLEVLLL